MKLKRFRVTNFRSILDSGWVDVGDVVAIVGKNESGKTSLLQALAKFNPHKEQPYSLDREWPRGRRKERSSKQTVIETEFEFSEVERHTLAQIHESATTITAVRIRKDYEGSFYYTFLPDHPAAAHEIKWVVSVLEGHLATLPVDTSEHFKTQYETALRDFIEAVRSNGGSTYATTNAAGFKSQYAGFHHPNNPPNNPAFQADRRTIDALNTATDAAVAELATATPLRRAIDTAHEWLPTFIYMDDYRIFAGSAQLDEVQQRFKSKNPREGDYTIRLIMEQAGLDLDEEVEKGKNEDREQRMLDMNDASITLTQEIADRWSQKKYEIRFSADGQHFIMFVKDAEAKALVPLEERSKGFQWFFSFDMLFMCETGGEFKNAVILLDEPGLHLHAAAQSDLLKRMKAYARDNQLIYTTHLPFMIDFTRLDNIYISEDHPNEGVKVHQNWATADRDARFTLQAALGLSWSQSLFVGRYNLVVEGVTDFWFLSTLSEILREAGEAGLDEELVITPAGGASKVAYIGTILRGQELNVAVLLDSDPEGKSAYEQLVHQWVLQEDHVLMLGSVLGAAGDRCLEDMFDESYYLGFVKKAYGKELGTEDLRLPDHEDQTIVQRVEIALQQHGITRFNKGRVAKRIMADLAGKHLSSLSQETVANFRKAIATVNELVQGWRSKASAATQQ